MPELALSKIDSTSSYNQLPVLARRVLSQGLDSRMVSRLTPEEDIIYRFGEGTEKTIVTVLGRLVAKATFKNRVVLKFGRITVGVITPHADGGHSEMWEKVSDPIIYPGIRNLSRDDPYQSMIRQAVASVNPSNWGIATRLENLPEIVRYSSTVGHLLSKENQPPS